MSETITGASLSTNGRIGAERMAGSGYALMGAKKKKKGIHIQPSHKGELHSALGVPQGQNIPPGKIASAANSSSPNLRRKAQFALNAKSFKH